MVVLQTVAKGIHPLYLVKLHVKQLVKKLMSWTATR